MASISLASCAGDYDDWANPQSNAQEEAKNVTLTIAPAAAINFTGLTADSVQFFNATIAAPNNMTATSYSVEVEMTDASGNTVKKSLNSDVQYRVATADLKQAVEDVYGKYPTTRTLKTVAKANLKCETGEAFYALSNQVENQVTPENFGTAFKIAINGVEAEMETSESTYPTFKYTTTVSGRTNYTIYDQNGEAVGEGLFTDEGKYNFTYDCESGFSDATKAPTELYMTGDHYDWGGTWKALTPVWGDDCDEFWTIVYLEEGEQFKFAPQQDWGNDFGMSATIDDQAGANLTGDNNCTVGKAGWYLLHVTNGDQRIIQVLEPNVYLMGDAAGEWNIGESHKFTVPATKDGQFVSPAFAKDAELRMCVNIPGHDWWQAEFIITDGNIDYRGKGGDQARLNVKEGEKAYLNFTDGTGEVK